MNTWNDGTIQIHRSEIEEAKREARKQAFEEAIDICNKYERPISASFLAEALRRERDKLA